MTAEIMAEIWWTCWRITTLDADVLAGHAQHELIARAFGFTNGSLEAWQKSANEVIRPGMQRHVRDLLLRGASVGKGNAR
jgi:hypothetical protein